MQSSDDGSIIVSVGGDRTVAVHDVESAVEIGDPISIPEDEVNAIALRPDGLELAIGGSLDRGMQIWDVDPRHWIDAACRLAGWNSTLDEWATNIGALLEYRPTCAAYPSDN